MSEQWGEDSMILYHGSNIEIEEIKLEKCRPYKDFGQGFYLTPIKEQAHKMAVRVSRIYGENPIVTIFEFEEEKSQTLNVKVFDSPIESWAKFVLNNRSRKYEDIGSKECNHDNKYDIVKGPIANDDLALLFRQFSSGLIDVHTLVKGMEYKKLTNQYSFHTNDAILCLKKVGVLNE